MIRVVFDTNIVISALLQPLGPPAQLLVLAIGGAIQPASADRFMPSTKRSLVALGFNLTK